MWEINIMEDLLKDSFYFSMTNLNNEVKQEGEERKSISKSRSRKMAKIPIIVSSSTINNPL